MDHLASERLTVAIPFYKGQAYLRLAIESVLRQSSSNWLLVVCDDGAESGTSELVASYADSRIRYLKNDRNLGMAGNWNRCLDEAKTDLVNLLHNDDELLPNYVETMLRAGRDYPQVAAFFCGAKIIDSKGREIFSFVDYVKTLLKPRMCGPLNLHGLPAVQSLMHGNFIMCPTVCYRKSRLGRERFSGCWRFVLDLEFFTRLLIAGETIIGFAAVAYSYRRHNENATEAYTESMTRFDEESLLHDQMAALARESGWKELAHVAARKRVIRLHLLFRIASDVFRMRFKPAVRKWRFLRRLLGEPDA